MKKTLLLLALTLGSCQLFAQKTQSGDIKKGWNGKCPEYMDCTTGEIQYFEYKSEMVIDAAEVCGPLGVKACIISKGRYDVDRSSKNGTTVTLACKPFDCKQTKPFAVEGTNPKGQNCNGLGNSCWYLTGPKGNNEQSYKLIITPIFDNGACVALKLTYPPGKSGKGGDPAQAGF
jgi:hypothetical protein